MKNPVLWEKLQAFEFDADTGSQPIRSSWPRRGHVCGVVGITKATEAVMQALTAVPVGVAAVAAEEEAEADGSF